MPAEKLMDLIDESAPEEGVVDVTGLEVTFANGSRRIELADADDGAVVGAVIEGGADTTRRMSAVEWDAAVAAAAVVEEVHSESTMRMSAIQSSELAALITPVDVSIEVDVAVEVVAANIAVDGPVVRFSAPRIVMPIPAPVDDDDDDLAVPVEQAAAPIVEAPAPAPKRSFWNAWTIGSLLALAGAAAGLVLVALEKI
jgi:hypothetical protein